MIRLKRVGRTNDASYRLIVTEKQRGPKSGRYIANLGTYDPRGDQKNLKAEEIRSWISKGAQPSPTVHNLLIGEGIIEGKKVNVLPKKRPIKKEVSEEEAEAQTEAPAPAEEAAPAPEAAPEPEATPATEDAPASTEEAPAETDAQ